MIGVIKGTMRQKKEVNGLPLPIASYKTQLKAPIRSLKVAINATQSGSGDPYPAGGGKNKFPFAEWYTAYNSSANNLLVGNDTVFLTSGTYTLSFEYKNVDAPTLNSFLRTYSEHLTVCDGTKQLEYKSLGVSTLSTDWTNKTITFTLTQDGWFGIDNGQLRGGIAFRNIQVEAGSSATSYSPYSNIRPIIGASECNVVRCGKNLFSYDLPIRDGYWSGTTFNGTNAIIPKAQANLWRYIRVYVEGLTTITLSGFDTQGGTNCAWLGSEDTSDVLGVFDASLKNGTKTVPNGAKYLCLTIYGINVKYETYDEAQLEVGSTATTYEQYQGNTYTIQLGDTYYGGSLDVTTGVLTVTKKCKQIPPNNLGISVSTITYVSGEMKSGNALAGLCDTFKTVNSSGSYGVRFGANNTTIYFYKLMDNIPEITDLNTAKQWFTEHPVNVCYELATPITVQLTPTQVEQLLGQNNVWADTGDVEELIYTDRQVYYGR